MFCDRHHVVAGLDPSFHSDADPEFGSDFSMQIRIRIFMLIRFRIRRSMPLTNGSGSGSWIRILLFSSLTFKMPAKNKFFHTILSACYFLKVNFYYFSKIKSQKESQNSRIQGFSYYFCMMIEGSGSESRAGSGSIPLTGGSGSGRPKNMWIQWIRIRIHPDSDPDSDPSGFGSGFGSIRIWIRIRIHPDSDPSGFRSGSRTLH